jgi:sulfite exporter TauE/SafE
MSWWLAVTGAALAGAPHCLGMCGALAVGGCATGGAVPYHLGRVATYAGLGALAGGLGAAVPGPPWVSSALSAVLLVGFAAALVGWLPEPRFGLPWVARWGARWMRDPRPVAKLAFGAVNGLLPCGLLYATLAVPVASGSAATGAALMAWFAALTALPLTAATLGLRRVLTGPRVRYVTAALVLGAGLYGLADRSSWVAAEGSAVESPSCH